MVTVTLTEAMVNAIAAGLDLRSAKLSVQLARLVKQPRSSDRDFAIDCTRDAIRHIVITKLAIAAALEDPEPPEDMTFSAWTEGEYQFGFGK